MRGWSLEHIGTIQYREDLQNPVIAEDEALVRIEAAGICGSDIPRVYQTGAHRMPLIIGHELAGQVIRSGSRCIKDWTGMRVGIFPLIPCRACPACRQKQYEMCEHYNYLGSRTNGGFAEMVAVPEWNLIELPQGVTYEQAAMLEPLAVARHAIHRLQLRPENSIAVCGLGTIGQLVLMLLLDMGFTRVYAMGSKEIHKKMAIRSGLPETSYCDGRREDPVEFLHRQTNGLGVDAYFECVGKNETISQAITCSAPEGQICLVGNPYSDLDLPKDIYWRILRKQLKVTGTWNSTFLGREDPEAVHDDWNDILGRLASGRIHPEKLISHRLKLEELEKGLWIMRDKSEEYIKIMCKVGE